MYIVYQCDIHQENTVHCTIYIIHVHCAVLNVYMYNVYCVQFYVYRLLIAPSIIDNLIVHCPVEVLHYATCIIQGTLL